MKLTVFLLLTAFLQANYAISNGQSIDLSEKNAPITQVFKKIRQQSGYHILYNAALLEKARPVNVTIHNASIQEALDKVLHNQGLDYVIKDHTVIIQKAAAPIIHWTRPKVHVQAPIDTLRGRVTDTLGTPLPGVVVLIKGANKGTQTDFDGRYLLKDVPENAVLQFNLLGFQPLEVAINGRSELSVQLRLDIGKLSETVVVSTGYQTLSKERATGAFVSVEEEQIAKPSSSIGERLVGAVPGLQSTINADGSIEFQIRGQSSLFADQEPLIVYDGFAIEGGLESINPNDVASITVLKDAAAASIWGAKSANGVIVVTSKKAKKGKTNISVSSFVKMSNKLNLDYVNAVANSGQVINYEQKGFNSDFFGGPWPPPSGTVSDLGSHSLAVTAMNEARLGRITPEARDATLARLRTLNNEQQIRDYLLQAPVTQQYNVNISGGSEKMTNNLSLMFEDSKTFYKGDKTQRFLINYANNVNIAKWLDFNFSGMFQYEKGQNNGVNLGFIQSLQPYDMLVNDDGSLTDMSYLNYYKPNFNAFIPKDKFPYSDWSYNPISEINNRDFSREDLNGRFQAGLTAKLIKGLTLASKIQYETFNSNNKNYYSPNSFAARQFVNETSAWNQDFNTPPTQNVPKGGILRQNKTAVKAYNFRNQLTFVRNFAKKHAINFVAGSEISNRVIEFTRNPDAFGYNDETLTTGELLNPIDGSSMWDGNPLSYARYFYPFDISATHQFTYRTDRYFSLYGNLAYTFDDKYTVTGSFRTDASNLIAEDPKYRYSPFWSVGIGWQLGREEFIRKYDWVDRLNMRLTYGYNGNVDKSTSFLPLININGTLNSYTEETTALISSYGNPTLRWEKTNTVNFGLDFSFMKGKLHGTFDYYDKKSSDLIVSQSIPSVNGTDEQKFNNGKMLNRGFEIQLGTSIAIKDNDIAWSGTVNYSYNKNRITEFYRTSYQMYDLYDGGTTSFVEGYNANTLWSLRYAGMTNAGTESAPYMLPSFYGTNGEKLTFQNWPIGNALEYESNEGTTVAPSTFGMINSFKIYNFDLSFIITAKFGHVFRRQGFNYSPMAGGNTRVNNRYDEVLNSDPSERVPIPDEEYRYYFWDRFFPYLDYLTQNASHIRIQEINLSYSLPRTVISKIGASSLKFFVQANNAGVILFNDYGEDPEYPVGTVKPQPTFTFGLRANL